MLHQVSCSIFSFSNSLLIDTFYFLLSIEVSFFFFYFDSRDVFVYSSHYFYFFHN